jgi:hypothetical protein
MGHQLPGTRSLSRSACSASLLLCIALAGCAATIDASHGSTGLTAAPATATRAATATAHARPTPHAVTSFTCAAGSLPVAAGAVRASCSITQEQGIGVLRAAYSGDIAVNDQGLRDGGWYELSQAHGDSPYGAIGWAFWVDQSAWFYYQYSGPTSQFSIIEGIPSDPRALVTCGQSVSVGAPTPLGLPLLVGAISLDAPMLARAMLASVPACLVDVQRFYETTVPAQTGCKLDTPFAPPAGSTPPTASGPSYLQTTCALGGSTFDIYLAGMPGGPTLVSIDQRP